VTATRPAPAYTAQATADGPRTGRAASDDGRLDVQLSRPKAMGGDDGPGTNPEQLFAAGYAACFHSAMRFALAPLGLGPEALEGATVTARVHFLRTTPTQFDLAVDLDGSLPAVDRETAQRVMEATHEICPYSRATRGNVEVVLTAV
jgi:osmotically inducible protein OsmC